MHNPPERSKTTADEVTASGKVGSPLALRVALNGKVCASISLAGLKALSGIVMGSQTWENVSFDVTGKRKDGVFLSWFSDFPLQLNDFIDISVIEDAISGDPGKPPEERHPGKDFSSDEYVESTPEELVAKIRSEPKFHETFSFRVTLPTGEIHTDETQPDEESFSFQFSWVDFVHQDQIHISLMRTTLEQLAYKLPRNKHLSLALSCGESIRFELTG